MVVWLITTLLLLSAIMNVPLWDTAVDRNWSMTSVRGPISQITVDNWHDMMGSFSQWVSELYARKHFREEYNNKTLKFEEGIQCLDKRFVTPDIKRTTISGRIIEFIEIKCVFSTPTDEKIRDLTAQFEKDYKDLGYPIRLEIIHVDRQFIIDTSVRDSEITLFMKWRNQLLSVGKLEELDAGDVVLPSDVLLKNHPYCKDYRHIRTDVGESKIEIFESILNNIEKVEVFANNNFLASAKMTDAIIDPNIPINIYHSHPWDWRRNKAVFEQVTGTTDFGHRANYLTYYPPRDDLIRSTLSEFAADMGLNKGIIDKHIAGLWEAITINSLCKPELDMIKKNTNTLAFLKTTDNNEIKTKIANLMHCELEDLETLLYATNKGLRDKIKVKSGLDIKLSKHGMPIVEMNSQISLKGNRSSFEIMRDSAVNNPNLGLHDFFTDRIDLTRGYSEPNKNLQINFDSYKNAYSNPSVEQLSDIMINRAKVNLELIMNSDSLKLIYSLVQFYRGVLAAVPRIESKKMALNEGVCTTHPDGFHYYITPSPNEITTGLIVCFGKMKHSAPINPWMMEARFFDNAKGEKCFITKPFRLNAAICRSADSLLGSFIGANLMFLEYGINMLHDELFTSLYLGFSRQLVLVSDIIYLYYKNTYNKGNFGRHEILKKMDDISLRDIRVSTILYRLRANFTKTVTDLNENNSYKFNLPDTSIWSGVKDPIFLFAHQNWQTALNVTYLKQIFPKNDGFDGDLLAAKFFLAELGFQDMYNKSRFNQKIHPEVANIKTDEFLDMIFDKNGVDWDPLGWHRNTIFNFMKDSSTKALNKNSHSSFFDKSWSTPALNTAVPSKCNIPDLVEEWYLAKEKQTLKTESELKERDKNKKSKYKGITSMKVMETLAFEIMLFEFAGANAKEYIIDHFWDTCIPKTGARQPTLLELTLFEATIYPKCVILTMVNKEQSGYGKRAFFVQLIFNRNCNKLWDESFRPIVATDPIDMILTPGMKKYIKFQDEMKELAITNSNMMISKDATKFGDTYQLEAFYVQIEACYASGYFSELEARLLLSFCDNLTRRVVIAPISVQNIFLKHVKNPKLLTSHENKWIVKFSEYNSLINSKAAIDLVADNELLQQVKNNICFKKEVGFTLGVMNVSGSAFTANYTGMIKEIEEHIGLTNLFRSKTHSDDAEDITKLIIPKTTDFESNNVTKFVKKFMLERSKYKQNNEELYLSKDALGNYFYLEFGSDKVVFVEAAVIAKFHLLLTLLTPRFFSQRPSLLKWGFGYANEVLQVVQHAGKVHVPLIRYAVSIGKDLPGKSPSTDTYMMTGRIFELISNGLSQTGSTSFTIMMNWLISDMYGLHTYNRTVQSPLEMGGLWYMVPALIYDQCFNGNEIRLQTLGNNVRNKLDFMVNTNAIWENELKHSDVNKTEISNVELEAEGGYDSMYRGSLESRRAVSINYQLTRKTSLAYGRLLQAMQPHVDNVYDSIIAQGNYDPLETDKSMSEYTLYEKMKFIKRNLTVEMNANPNEMRMKAVSVLSRYTSKSFQDSYARVTPDLKTVSRLGFLKRSITNPFNKKFQEQKISQLGLVIPDVLTVEDFWKLSEILSQIPGILPLDNVRAGNLMRDVLSVRCAEMNTMCLDMDSYYITTIHPDLEFNCVYRDVNSLLHRNFLGRDTTKAVVAYYEMHKYNLPLNKTSVVRLFPKLNNDPGFVNQIAAVTNILTTANIGLDYIKSNFTLLTRLLSDSFFEGICKISSGNSRIQCSLLDNFAYREGLNVFVRYDNNRPIDNVVKMEVASGVFSFNQALRFFNVVAALNKRGIVSNTGKLAIQNRVINITESNSDYLDILNTGSTSYYASWFLSRLNWDCFFLKNRVCKFSKTTVTSHNNTRHYWDIRFYAIGLPAMQIIIPKTQDKIEFSNYRILISEINGLSCHNILRLIQIVLRLSCPSKYCFDSPGQLQLKRDVETPKFAQRTMCYYKQSEHLVWETYTSVVKPRLCIFLSGVTTLKFDGHETKINAITNGITWILPDSLMTQKYLDNKRNFKFTYGFCEDEEEVKYMNNKIISNGGRVEVLDSNIIPDISRYLNSFIASPWISSHKRNEFSYIDQQGKDNEKIVKDIIILEEKPKFTNYYTAVNLMPSGNLFNLLITSNCGFYSLQLPIDWCRELIRIVESELWDFHIGSTKSDHEIILCMRKLEDILDLSLGDIIIAVSVPFEHFLTKFSVLISAYNKSIPTGFFPDHNLRYDRSISYFKLFLLITYGKLNSNIIKEKYPYIWGKMKDIKDPAGEMNTELINDIFTWKTASVKSSYPRLGVELSIVQTYSQYVDQLTPIRSFLNNEYYSLGNKHSVDFMLGLNYIYNFRYNTDQNIEWLLQLGFKI